MLTKKFNFKVPDNLIALNPIIPRNHSKLVEVGYNIVVLATTIFATA